MFDVFIENHQNPFAKGTWANLPQLGILLSLKKMLQKAVDRGLQVILLTCDPDSYDNFAEKRILLRPIINNFTN